MAILEGFGVRNFGVLKNVKLGLLWNDGKKTEPLTPMTAVIGKNGVGKSALFDAFGSWPMRSKLTSRQLAMHVAVAGLRKFGRRE